jgi:hypothetical protein
LSVAVGDDGRTLVHCHAGCAPEDVVGALGLKLADLMAPKAYTPPPPRKAKALAKVYPTAREAIRAIARTIDGGSLAHTWQYRDANGEPVAAVARFDLPTPLGQKTAKTFRPVCRIGHGWKIGDPKQWPLYRVPDVVKAAGKRAFVTEGERAADAAAALGLVATTSAHGAQSPDKTDWAPLARAAEIIIMPDADSAGEAYAQTVAGILLRLNPLVKVRILALPNLPPKGDIVEFVAARKAAELGVARIRAEVEALANAAPLWQPAAAATADGDASEETEPVTLWPDPLSPEAFHGLAGELVRRVEPHTEADPVAVLVQFLVLFGNIIGRKAHFRVEATRHYLNEYAVLMGQSSKARKGTAYDQSLRLLAGVDESWAAKCIGQGLSSGEGLIYAVRDAHYKKEPVKEKGKLTGDYVDVMDDEGVEDKRLVVVEPEFANVLKVAAREGNTLSPVIRCAWDSGDLRSMVKNNPARATSAHISMIGHITAQELKRELNQTESANGFANRYLWLLVRRSKYLPDGGAIHLEDFTSERARLAQAVKFGNREIEMRRDDAAACIWREIYAELSTGGEGMSGAMLGRAEAHVMRLACLYALLDLSGMVRPEHLLAALALWDYCAASVKYVFGTSTGNRVAEDILAALRQKPEGMTRTQISKHFNGHLDRERIATALKRLHECRLVTEDRQDTGGAPRQVWRAAGREKRELSEKSPSDS